MRILLVEDEIAVATEIAQLLRDRCGAEVIVARSRDSAVEVLEADQDFDLIVCDLRIPTSDGGLDVAEDHGFRVHDFAREHHPGVPSMFFSGFVTLDNVRRRLAEGPSVDLLGTGALWPIVDVRPKEQQPEFIARSVEIAAGLSDLDSLDVDFSGSTTLTTYQARPLRVYARRLGGVRFSASPLGGLSGAMVLRGEVVDASQSSVGVVVAKIALVAEIADELSRFRQHVAPVVEIGAFAPLAGEVLFGAGRFAAAFYSLAAKWNHDLFELVVADPDAAAASVRRLKEALSVWRRTEVQSDLTIGELRSTRVRDDHLAPYLSELDRMAWRDVEATTVSTRIAVQHGDLHGRNVLVDDDGEPLIIDYGDVGPAPAVLDPVTLELSLLLHDEHPDLGGWPAADQAEAWFDLDHYVEGAPIADLVRVCREWAFSVSDAPEEVAAVVYAHSVRQLKYSDTDKELALAIAAAAARVILRA